nr:DEAD/DEAH box helicase family protein [Tropicimonas sp. IMCC6043]
MSRHVPYLAEEAIERDAAALLAEFEHVRSVVPAPPIPIEDIVEKHLKLRIEFGDLHARHNVPRPDNGQTDILGAIYGDGSIFIDQSLDPEENPALDASTPREITLSLDDFPEPADLWTRFRAWKGLDGEAEQIMLQDYYDDGSGKTPRYYQVNAVNAAIEAIAKGQDRVLLVMATGTGKTYTAFQIIWRLWKAGRKKRILFLADRNVLIDQTMVNDFRPFGGTMAKLSTNAKTIERQDGSTEDLTPALDRKRRIDTAYEVYLGLYQAITGPEERQKLFREFSPGFFDLIVIDECHRGSAAEDSAWREILEYFSSATQIGMTATPKETKYLSNIAYFGEAIARLQAEHTRLGERISAMYVDKLDGKMSSEFFEEMSGKWREEQRRLQRDIERHEEAEQSYMEEGLRILDLARNAQALFERQPARDKRRLLNFVLSNCTWEEGEVIATFRQPFDMLAETTTAAARITAGKQPNSAKNDIWLGW